MTGCHIIGVGMTRFDRHPDTSLLELCRDAVTRALDDADVSRRDIQTGVFSNATQALMESVNYVRGQVVLRQLGFSGLPVTNVENACASAATALQVACQQIAAGVADVVLVVGAEKMFSADKGKMFKLFGSDWDLHATERILREFSPYLVDLDAPGIDLAGAGQTRSAVMDAYAAFARLHMALYGLTARQIAEVAAKNHRHSVHNPNAQFRHAMTADEVLAARQLAWPITVPMCAPVSDGAAAAVVVSDAARRRLGARRAVKIAASVLAGGTDRAPHEYDQHVCRRAAWQAYERAGIGPQDVSVAEVHDASAFGEVLQSEVLGFWKFGEGGPRGAAGETSIGGSLPINPSGGLVCRGHPLGATGLAQIHELVMQLRGEAGPRQVAGAATALAENGGGLYGVEEAAAAVTILQR